MALMTGEQYVESMRKMNLQIYMFGKKIENLILGKIFGRIGRAA